jgi:hypothetical protein
MSNELELSSPLALPRTSGTEVGLDGCASTVDPKSYIKNGRATLSSGVLVYLKNGTQEESNLHP